MDEESISKSSHISFKYHPNHTNFNFRIKVRLFFNQHALSSIECHLFRDKVHVKRLFLVKNSGQKTQLQSTITKYKAFFKKLYFLINKKEIEGRKVGIPQSVSM